MNLEQNPAAKSPEARNLEIAANIGQMFDEDQKMRKADLENPEDETIWDDSLDERNTKEMNKIISEIGWPTISRVGAEASHKAWLLVQHADRDPEFQEYCLSLLKGLPTGEVKLRNIAYLEDRVRVNTGRPQVYGTQFQDIRDEETNTVVIGYGPKEIENFGEVNERRAGMGLEPFEEYLKEITGRYYPQFLKDIPE